MIMLGCEKLYYDTWREDLSAWATKKEVKQFDKKFGKDIEQANEDYRLAQVAAAEAADRDAQARRQAQDDAWDNQASTGSSSSSGGGSSSSGGGSSAPTVVSVTLRNSCSSTVKVFFGDNPKFGSGRQSSLGGNSRTSQQMKPGDMVWVIDDSSNGLASATVSSSTREIEVTSSCTSISSR